ARPPTTQYRHCWKLCTTESWFPQSSKTTTSIETQTRPGPRCSCASPILTPASTTRSEEHTSELQSRRDLVCRLLLEKKNKKIKTLVPLYPGPEENVSLLMMGHLTKLAGESDIARI